MIGDRWTTSAHTTAATRPAGADVASGGSHSPRWPRGGRLPPASPPRPASRRGRAARPALGATARPLRAVDRRRRHRPTTQAPHGTVTIAAVGDTMLGITPTLAPSPGTYIGRMRVRAHRRRRLREPRGDAHRRHGLEVRRRAVVVVLRVPGAAGVRPRPAPVRASRSSRTPTTTPSTSSRRARTTRCARSIAPGSPRPACPARSRSSARKDLRIAFLGFAPYPNTGVADRPPRPPAS